MTSFRWSSTQSEWKSSFSQCPPIGTSSATDKLGECACQPRTTAPRITLHQRPRNSFYTGFSSCRLFAASHIIAGRYNPLDGMHSTNILCTLILGVLVSFAVAAPVQPVQDKSIPLQLPMLLEGPSQLAGSLTGSVAKHQGPWAVVSAHGHWLIQL